MISWLRGRAINSRVHRAGGRYYEASTALSGHCAHMHMHMHMLMPWKHASPSCTCHILRMLLCRAPTHLLYPTFHAHTPKGAGACRFVRACARLARVHILNSVGRRKGGFGAHASRGLLSHHAPHSLAPWKSSCVHADGGLLRGGTRGGTKLGDLCFRGLLSLRSCQPGARFGGVHARGCAGCGGASDEPPVGEGWRRSVGTSPNRVWRGRA